MRTRALSAALVLAGALAIAVPTAARAQVFDKLKEAAEDAVTREAQQQAERLLREAIRCALNDPACPQDAEEQGKETIYVDEDGEVITDDDGVPITDRDEAMDRAGVEPGAGEGAGMAAPGEGVWANYDFVPGDDILYYDDYSGERVGDFPRRMTFLRGNWEIVERGDARLLRNTGGRSPAVEIPLPRELPERFTIEFDAHVPHGNSQLAVATFVPESDRPRINRLEGPHFLFGRNAGVASGQGGGPQAMTSNVGLREDLQSVRIMVDGRYAKVYVNEKRVANVPNVDLERGRSVYFQTTWGTDSSPILIGPIRVAAGGRDLYDDLLDDGRAVTRGILFAVNSDRIRPESTPTLQAIGRMLTEHPELRLRVEGHTDADGEEAHNLDLSERRAASVKAYLVESHGIDAGRLETVGLGESQPVADNLSAEGKQKNRRVELVRLEG